jgi:hypothetical protein
MNHPPLETKSSAKADAAQEKRFETFNFGHFVLIFLILGAHPIEFHHTIMM